MHENNLVRRFESLRLFLPREVISGQQMCANKRAQADKHTIARHEGFLVPSIMHLFCMCSFSWSQVIDKLSFRDLNSQARAKPSSESNIFKRTTFKAPYCGHSQGGAKFASESDMFTRKV